MEFDEATMIGLARDASQKAHAPYSKFRVGAALLARDGTVFCGCNVECSTYGGTICAERVALTKAVSEGVKQFTHLVVYTDTDEPTPPCGICRQFLMDFAPDLTVVSACRTNKRLRRRLSNLLPDAFLAGHLNKP